MFGKIERSFSSGTHSRWICQNGTVNGNRLNLEKMAQDISLKERECTDRTVAGIWCSASLDEDHEIDVSSLKVWINTETHGTWCLNKTTGVMKEILVLEYGAFIPWFRR